MGTRSTRSSSPGLWARTSTPRSRSVFQRRSRDWCAHASTSCRRQHETSLLLAAAAGRPSAELFASLDVTEHVLDRALAARVIERTDGTIRFTHPLLASVVYHGVSADERRRAHGRLALVVADPLDRARHLALSTESPDTRDRRCSRGCRGPGRAPAAHQSPPPSSPSTRFGSRRRTPTATGIAERSLRHALSAARASGRAREAILADLLAETRAGSCARRGSCPPCRARERTSFRPTARGSPARGGFAPSASVSHPLSARVGELQARVRPCT